MFFWFIVLFYFGREVVEVDFHSCSKIFSSILSKPPHFQPYARNQFVQMNLHYPSLLNTEKTVTGEYWFFPKVV